MNHQQQRMLEHIASNAAARKTDATRHRCFVSYHAADLTEVSSFLDDFGTEFIGNTVGVTDEDDFIDSEDSDYIMDRIRTKYLGNTTVTIVLIGRCTWARRYVDWEIFSSLRNSKYSSVNGLLAISLPSTASSPGKQLPQRLADNLVRDSEGRDIGYARWMKYPSSSWQLRSWIDDAYHARTSRSQRIANSRPRKHRNSSCR